LEIARAGLRAYEPSNYTWLSDTPAVVERARSQKRSGGELTDMDYRMATWDIVAEAAVNATFSDEEALAMIGECVGHRNAPASVRYEAAAGYRKAGNSNGKHWWHRYGTTVVRRLAEELYILVMCREARQREWTERAPMLP
jgi:hypothetical protein